MAYRSRFGFRYSPQLVFASEQANARHEIFTPTKGLHRGDALQDLEPGFSGDVSNMVIESGRITPRSGLSSFRTASGLSDAAQGLFVANDILGNNFMFAPSTRSVAFFDPTTDVWSRLSYQRPSGWGADDMPSGSSRNAWDAAVVYEPSADANIVAMTNGVDTPFLAVVGASSATYSSLTNFHSLASSARAVCAFDNRLVWFNIADSTTTYPQRVLWSPRGSPQLYSLAAGAGFEDLMDMRGVGVRLIADGDGLLLFTDEQIWRARKRNDNYVFDFYAIERHFGTPYPRTIARTPQGVIFLGRDLELYTVAGDQVIAIGPQQVGESSRIQGLLQETLYDGSRAWAVYNSSARRYELNYVGGDSRGGYATRGLWYSLPDNAFLPQNFGVELSAGADYEDPGDAGPTWDTVAPTLTWDGSALEWDQAATPGTVFNVCTISSAGTSYRFRSEATNDAGAAMPAYWTSHALNREDQMAYDTITELWLEYQATETSAFSVDFMGDPNGSVVHRSRLTVGASHAGRAFLPGFVTSVSPQFRVYVDDGTRPKISRFQAKLVGAGTYGA